MLAGDARESGSHVPGVHGLLGPRPSGEGIEPTIAGGPGPGPPPPIHVRRPIAGDTVQPRREARAGGVEGRRVAPDAREGILDQLLGQLCVAQQPHPRGVHRPRVTVVEFRERLLVPTGYQAQQVLVSSVPYLPADAPFCPILSFHPSDRKPPNSYLEDVADGDGAACRSLRRAV